MRVVATPAWCRACFDVFGSRARVSESVWLRLGNLRELRRRVCGSQADPDVHTDPTDDSAELSTPGHGGRRGQGRQGPGPRTVSVTQVLYRR